MYRLTRVCSPSHTSPPQNTFTPHHQILMCIICWVDLKRCIVIDNTKNLSLIGGSSKPIESLHLCVCACTCMCVYVYSELNSYFLMYSFHDNNCIHGNNKQDFGWLSSQWKLKVFGDVMATDTWIYIYIYINPCRPVSNLFDRQLILLWLRSQNGLNYENEFL